MSAHLRCVWRREEPWFYCASCPYSRVSADLTQERLAERAGLSPRAISDLECGVNHVPRRDTFDLLASALELSPQDRAEIEGTIDRRRKPRATLPTPPSPQPASDAPREEGAGFVTPGQGLEPSPEAASRDGTEPGMPDSMSTAGRMSRVERRAWALQYLATAGEMSPGTYLRVTGVDRKTALTDLLPLIDQGHIRVHGATRDRRYTLHRDN